MNNTPTLTTSELLEQMSARCDALRTALAGATQELQDLNRRLEQIIQQLHKNIEVRDASFAADFNNYCCKLRKELDELDTVWSTLRAQSRACKPADWTAELILPAKGLNSHAKTLSRACDEFITAYDIFARTYKGFTAVKLNVWLLTACQNDFFNLTGKILFLAREIARHTEQKRGNHAAG